MRQNRKNNRDWKQALGSQKSGQKTHNPSNNKKPERQTVRGIIHMTSKGVGYVEATGFKEDIEIEAGFVGVALNRDEVEIALLPKVKGKRARGEVMRVTNRVKKEFVGTIEKGQGGYFLVPDNKKIHRDFTIVKKPGVNTTLNQKVLIRMLPWNDPKKNPEGEIVKIIGEKGVHEVEMQSIILDKGINSDFPPEVTREAEAMAEKEKPKLADEIRQRKDFRNTLTFTIDPLDAKDFDDAISFKEIAPQKYEIGVHIADVSHYVREGTLLDKEAEKRGFSVYLVDRTIPMLPEVLSNDVCSLKPDQDRLTFSAVFIIEKAKNGKWNVIERWFGKTVIHSAKRFTYEDAQASLDNPRGTYHKQLTTLNTIAKQFREEKMKNGAIDFERDEVKFKLDPNGVPIGVYKKARLDTHKLVEEFMLLANREVAIFIDKKGTLNKKLSIYRVHDVPDKEKIMQLSIFVKALGFNLETKHGEVTAYAIASLLKQVAGKPVESMIKTVTLRSMAKAVYSTGNIGHFGLGFKHYTHFTSPIRRYADLVIHRILHHHLDGLRQSKGLSGRTSPTGLVLGGKVKPDEFAMLARIARETSEKEIAASEAERASIKYKQVEYMTKHVGETFDAIISGVTEWGIFVEENETKSEGMVRLRSLGNDFYNLDEKTYSIVGEKTGEKFSLGEKVRVKLVSADLDRKSLDFVFV